MSFNILERIRSRSREQWQTWAKDNWTDLRIWIQENGELSALIGLLLGIFIVLAFRLIITLTVLALLLVFAAWCYAKPDSALSATGRTSKSNGRDDMSPPSANGHSS